jgi:hypothetical protein
MLCSDTHTLIYPEDDTRFNCIVAVADYNFLCSSSRLEIMVSWWYSLLGDEFFEIRFFLSVPAGTSMRSSTEKS